VLKFETEGSLDSAFRFAARSNLSFVCKKEDMLNEAASVLFFVISLTVARWYIPFSYQKYQFG
jgi:hypothetical protein